MDRSDRRPAWRRRDPNPLPPAWLSPPGHCRTTNDTNIHNSDTDDDGDGDDEDDSNSDDDDDGYSYENDNDDANNSDNDDKKIVMVHA